MCNPDKLLLSTPRFRVIRVRDGVTGFREVIRHPGAVTILPLLEEGRICLIRNQRVSVNETLVELPAGTLEPGEEPIECARRELAEETGYRAGALRPLHTYYVSPGILDERMHLFLATELQLGNPAREKNEQIENLVVDWDDALRRVDDGEIEDAKTIVALLLYERLRDQLKLKLPPV